MNNIMFMGTPEISATALKKLIDDNGGLKYAQQYYKFTLLEIVESNIEDDLDNRENYWKKVLLSRMDGIGHNKN